MRILTTDPHAAGGRPRGLSQVSVSRPLPAATHARGTTR
jgi:hypothetical protein